MPHRYFTTDISGGTAVLSGADAHHLAHVMRARPGETAVSYTHLTLPTN